MACPIGLGGLARGRSPTARSRPIIDRCLDTWTLDMVEGEFERRFSDVRQFHTRWSILLPLLSHDAFQWPRPALN